MSSTPDPAGLTIEQARLEIRARRLSAVELTEAVLARAERLNPELRAYLYLDPDAALAQARAADARGEEGALKGIPICVKDVIDVAGIPTTAGAASWRRTPSADATAVARLRAAGAVVLGKGHTNEFGYGIDGKNPHHGPCRNPYDPARLAGGSSSGPAVATASGMALAGLGTDTSGSIRVPASLCGLVGIRPTPGRIPLAGVLPLAWSYDTAGPLARTVADASILSEVLSSDEGRTTGARSPGQERPGTAAEHGQGLRIGLIEQLFAGVEPYVETAVRETAAFLAATGADIVAVQLDRLRYVNAMHQLVQQAEAAQVHKPWFEAQRGYYSRPVLLRLEAGRLLPASAYLAAQQARRLLIEEIAITMKGLDAMLAPSTPLIAPPQQGEEVAIRGTRHDLRAALLQCVLLASQLACPVIALPIGSDQGLPFGMQIIGRPFSEPILLSIAATCERRWQWTELGTPS